MEGFSYETELVDHMSGPAGKESAALDGLAQAAMHAEGAIRGLGEAHEKAGHMSLEAKGFMKEFTGSLVPEIALGELAAEGLKTVAEGALEVGEKFADLAVEGVHFALEMRDFKEDAINAYSILQGTAEEGEATFAEIDKLARAVHMPVEKAHDMAQRLMEQGLENTREVEGVIQAVSDLQRTGNERGAERLQRVIERSLSSGTFQLGKRGLAGIAPVEDVLQELSSSLHRPVEQIKADMKAGHISAEQGIVAIENTFAHSKIHQIAAQQFQLGDVVTDIKNAWKGAFEDIDTEPLMNALHDMAWAFGMVSDKGGGLKETITEVFNWIVKETAPIVDEITILGLNFEIGFLKARAAAQPLIDDMARMGLHVVDLDGLEKAAQGLAESLTTVVIRVGWLIAKFEQLRELTHPAEVGGHEIGTGFVEGLLSSMTGGIYGVAKAAHGLIEAGLDSAHKAADAHSPSRKTYALGGDLGTGLVMGVRDSRDEVSRAMGDLSDPSEMMRGRGGEGGGGRSVTIEEGAIQAHVHASQAGATAEEIREVTESALEDVLEKLLLELGG